jgi:hypothetical protein
MLENKVNIYFHGHDHFYGKQEKDGMIYQEVPQPSAKNIKSFNEEWQRNVLKLFNGE